MRRVALTDRILVSELCYGTLTLGPLQKGLTPTDGGRLIACALERGITFFDTAELYETYAHLRAGLSGGREAVIATKSYAFDAAGMQSSLERARRELNRDYIDIFLLHEQESVHTLRGHAEALEYLCTAKARGMVKAVGISTHHVAGVRAASLHPQIDVIHPLINIKGIGIPDGSREDMASAIAGATQLGKSIYAMKALAGGALYSDAGAALHYVRGLDGVSAVAVGMGSQDDIDANVSFFSSGSFHAGYQPQGEKRKVIVEPWCEGCGRCVIICPTQAITLSEGRACIDHDRCLLCSYCVAHCRDFYLKVIEC